MLQTAIRQAFLLMKLRQLTINNNNNLLFQQTWFPETLSHANC